MASSPQLKSLAVLLLAACLANWCAGCGSVGPISGSPFSGIPAQTEPEVDHADSSRSK